MMQINCPHCGPRAQAEFIYERTVDSVVALDAAPEEANLNQEKANSTE